MPIETLSQAEIDALINCQKRIRNPGSRSRTKGKHIERDFQVGSSDGKHEFVVFTRQSTLIPESFSAGLRWRSKTGEEVILLRCNGPDHEHFNPLEKHRFAKRCHIHLTTERYLALGRKAEAYAEITEAYQSLDGALHHLTQLANITGIETQPDEPDLFNTP